MNAFELSVYLEPIIKSCSLWKKKDLHAVIIANPKAGGFMSRKISSVHEETLVDFCAACSTKITQCKNFSIDVYETEQAGKTTKFIQRLVKGAAMPDEKHVQYLIITAGGDGTSLEVQTALAKIYFELGADYAEIISKRFTVLRLPFGTGNDGSDGRILSETLSLLTEPAHFSLQRAVRVVCGEDNGNSKKRTHYDSLSASPPWYSFNIASIGIDAFITHMTNKTKNIFPGNFYKIWIDLACFFYGFIFPSKMARIKTYSEDGTLIRTIETPILFALLGVSGHRTYGSNQKIIPDERNVCIAKKMNLFWKLLLKGKFKAGTHTNSNKAFFILAEKMIIDYGGPILCQMDGEVHYVEKEAFPLVMEKTEPFIRIIEREDALFYKGAEPIV